MVILSILWAIAGLLIGGVINVLADDLPNRRTPGRPHCPRCQHVYSTGQWLAITRQISGGSCPECGLGTRRRPIVVELMIIPLFALLPWIIEPLTDLVIYSLFVSVLVLIIIIDQEHRLVLHVVTYPTTAMAILLSFVLTDTNIRQSLVGAAIGFLFFYVAYLIGRRLFGPGALGFGDVTLAMTMGAMLGFQRIFFALSIGILLAGAWGLIALISGRMQRRSYFAYGPFLAIGGILSIIFGNQMYSRMIGS